MTAIIPTHTRLIDWLGVGGVHPAENPTALLVDKLLRWPLLIIAFWLPLQWHLFDKNLLSVALNSQLSWICWSVFLFETICLTSLVDNKTRYLLSNWTNLVIIGSVVMVLYSHVPLSGALRLLRLLIIPRLIITWWVSQ